MTTYKKDQEYTLKVVNTDNEVKEIKYTPDKDMSKPEMIMALKSKYKNFFKLIENKKLESYGETKYEVSAYYGIDFKGLEDSLKTDNYSEVEDFIWEKLQRGSTVELIDTETGDRKRYSPETHDYGDETFGIDDYLIENKRIKADDLKIGDIYIDLRHNLQKVIDRPMPEKDLGITRKQLTKMFMPNKQNIKGTKWELEKIRPATKEDFENFPLIEARQNVNVNSEQDVLASDSVANGDYTVDDVKDMFNNLPDNIKGYLENIDNVPTKDIEGTLWFDITQEEKEQLEQFVNYIDTISEDMWRKWDEKTKLDMSSYANNADRICRNCTLKLESKDIKTESENINTTQVENYHLEDMGGHTMAVFGKLKNGNYFAGNEGFINIYDADLWELLGGDDLDKDTSQWEQEHLIKNLSGEYSKNRQENKEYFDIISQTSFFDKDDLADKKDYLELNEKVEEGKNTKNIPDTIIYNFNNAYEDWGKETGKTKKEFIPDFIEAEFWDMGADFMDYEDWRDFIEFVPALKNFDDTKEDYELDNWDITAIKRNIANWETKIINDFLDKNENLTEDKKDNSVIVVSYGRGTRFPDRATAINYYKNAIAGTDPDSSENYSYRSILDMLVSTEEPVVYDWEDKTEYDWWVQKGKPTDEYLTEARDISAEELEQLDEFTDNEIKKMYNEYCSENDNKKSFEEWQKENVDSALINELEYEFFSNKN